MIKVILFDLGNVIISYKPNEYFRYLSRVTGRPLSQVMHELNRYGIQMETGKIRKTQFDSVIKRKMGTKSMAWLEYYSKHAHIKQGALLFAKQLRSMGYQIGCLTNIDSGAYYYSIRNFDMSVFSKRFASFRIGLRKPDPRIYKYVIRRLGVKPCEIMLIDDMYSNISAARKAGMKAVHFQNLKDAKKQALSIIARHS
ncbi:MAG: HAD family phosphatase [Candidatus Micrarchaeaceae archaeon]